jgi:hypothetical protein
VGSWLAEQFWRAGVPGDVLQLVVCPDDEVGRRLVTHPDVTRGRAHRRVRDGGDVRRLEAGPAAVRRDERQERDGDHGAADIDQAIADLVRSAFGHAGQKCSAASLGIVEAAVYDDPSFRRRSPTRCAAFACCRPPTPRSMMGPVIAPPTGDARACTHDARGGGAVAGGAAVPRRPRSAVVAGRAGRRAVRLVVPPHRVLRPGARPDARRRPRPALWWLEEKLHRTRRESRRAQLCEPVPPACGRAAGRRGGRACPLRGCLGGDLRPGARSQRAALRAERVPLPAVPRGGPPAGGARHAGGDAGPAGGRAVRRAAGDLPGRARRRTRISRAACRSGRRGPSLYARWRPRPTSCCGRCMRPA